MACACVLQDEEAVLLRIKLAQKLGVLSCSECSLAALPAQFMADDSALAAVQVRTLHMCYTANQSAACYATMLGWPRKNRHWVAVCVEPHSPA
jgi:hypothetical protein